MSVARFELESSRLIYSAPAPADADLIFRRYAADAEVTRYVGWPRHLSIADTRAFLDFSAAHWERWHAGPYLIRKRSDGRLLGGTGLQFDNPDEAMTGYVLARDAWGRGYATEALQTMVDLSSKLGMARLYARCHREHRASRRVLEKCGFALDRSWSGQVEFPNLAAGASRDAVSYELILIAGRQPVVDPESVLAAWFGGGLDSTEALGARSRLWFAHDAAFDEFLRAQFGTLPDRALRGELAAWLDTPRSALALVLALDQFPRNLFRGSARSFACDAAAQESALTAIERSFDASLHPAEAVFLYMPFEHAEDLALQRKSVALFRGLLARAPAPLVPQFQSFLSYAERHCAVIERFGRFPHRNELLGRESTPEEEEYLRAGGETFSTGRGGG